MLSYQLQKDKELVMMTLAGDQSAYEALVTRYQKSVLATAVAVTKNSFLAEDAAQDAFVTAWMKLDTLREPERFGAWVSRIAQNCAVNTLCRFRLHLPLDDFENLPISDLPDENPAKQYADHEETVALHRTVERLPQKVSEIIRMHYFEDLSIAEIAKRMGISTGTVKWHLHDGRRRLRKELSAMDEKWNDTLVQKVMKKVEELKAWQYRNSKEGFEAVYREVLAEVEDLPESTTKHHAMADVLMRGWWWIPGEKNDALLSRIKESALMGDNEDVLRFIVQIEENKFVGISKLRFIRDIQIPSLEETKFKNVLGHEWFRLGECYIYEKEYDNALSAFEKALSILSRDDCYYAMTLAVREMRQRYLEEYKDRDIDHYYASSSMLELRRINGDWRRYNGDRIWAGEYYTVDHETDDVFREASLCDSYFTVKGLSVGVTYTGSLGTELTYLSNCERVQTPAGTFEACQLWEIKGAYHIYRTFYKEGVGIVKLEKRSDEFCDVRWLKSYKIVGGEGLLPLATGNEWEYTADFNPAYLRHCAKFKVHYADEERAILFGNWEFYRECFDENSWFEMITQIRTDYWRNKKGYDKIADVYHAIERAKALATTPVEIAHTRVAAAVAQRIMETNPEFNPNHTATGHWNFFRRSLVKEKDGNVTSHDDWRWSFEWKIGGSKAWVPLLFNDVYGILEEVTETLWSDLWQPGADLLLEFKLWERYSVKTHITCEAAEPVTVKAGCFDDCIKLTLDVDGFANTGLGYYNGKKEYYFAKGVGIIRTVNSYKGKDAIYELTSYKGTGEGYLPLCDGLTRRYDAVGLTDGYVGAVEYTFVSDEQGRLVILSDQIGIRILPPPITTYSAIQGEIIEDRLWEEQKLEESRVRNRINTLCMFEHMISRYARTWRAQEYSSTWGKTVLRMLEALSNDGSVPPAWIGYYAQRCLGTAAATFRVGKCEEAYGMLERALEYFKKWDSYPDGEALDVGDPCAWGDIKVIKGTGEFLLPDGTRETNEYDSLFTVTKDTMYKAMTAPTGWEWFNSVRFEERFKEYVERAKELADQK